MGCGWTARPLCSFAFFCGRFTLEEKHLPEQGHGPLFVVGMWRSGTSLFYALLNQHPQIKLMYEDELPLLWPLFLGSRQARLAGALGVLEPGAVPSQAQFRRSSARRFRTARSVRSGMETLRSERSNSWRQVAQLFRLSAAHREGISRTRSSWCSGAIRRMFAAASCAPAAIRSSPSAAWF